MSGPFWGSRHSSNISVEFRNDWNGIDLLYGYDLTKYNTCADLLKSSHANNYCTTHLVLLGPRCCSYKVCPYFRRFCRHRKLSQDLNHDHNYVSWLQRSYSAKGQSNSFTIAIVSTCKLGSLLIIQWLWILTRPDTHYSPRSYALYAAQALMLTSD